MAQSTQAVRRATAMGLDAAVHRSATFSRAGLLERLFTLAFRGLVYPQIWEDPVVDMAALRIRPDDHVVAIASGGCNALSYLAAGPARVSAVDLNGAHVALGRLKLCALRHLPDQAAFFAFFGRADSRANVAAYDRHLKPNLDAVARAYWDARGMDGRRRIAAFGDNFFRHGLLGRFIGAGHRLAGLYGCDLGAIVRAETMAEQRVMFERHVAPIFDKAFVRWLMRQPASLYGLGIPPTQYASLSKDGAGGIGPVLRERLERLACAFPIQSNYFAWQAFGRRYGPGPAAALPPYLQPENFDLLRARADRISFEQSSMTALLRASPPMSFDCFVLLDAQDWMTDADLTDLWTQIARTARPGSRVIFRTAADERLLPGRVPAALLDAWTYDPALCSDLGARDRSSIYGAFHLYTLADRRT